MFLLSLGSVSYPSPQSLLGLRSQHFEISKGVGGFSDKKLKIATATFEKIAHWVVIRMVVGYGLRMKFYLTIQHHDSAKIAPKHEKYKIVPMTVPRASMLAQAERPSRFC